MYNNDIDNEQQPEPIDGDYVLSDCGPLGCRTALAVCGERFIGEYDEEDDALAEVRRRMEAEHFWPAVWRISDHGNAIQITFCPR